MQIPTTGAPKSPIWQLIDTRSVGGIERHVATLAHGLRGLGHPCEVVLYQDHGPNPWLRQLAGAGVSHRFLEGGIVALMRAIARERPPLIHTHGYKAGILGRTCARLARVPVVSTYHSGETAAFPVNAYYIIDNALSILCERIAVSAPIAAKLPVRAHLIPNFVVPPVAARDTAPPRRVGFVGRLSPEKAPDIFCALAQRSPPGLDWHVYGDGPMRADLEARFGATVRFHGIIQDMSAVWPTLGLLVIPSRYEGLPLAALEALSSGVPVLASRVGGLPSAVIEDDTGWLFEVGDLDRAAAGLASWAALDDDARLAQSHRCWSHVVAHFSQTRHLPDIMAVYRRAGWRGGG